MHSNKNFRLRGCKLTQLTLCVYTYWYKQRYIDYGMMQEASTLNAYYLSTLIKELYRVIIEREHISEWQWKQKTYSYMRVHLLRMDCRILIYAFLKLIFVFRKVFLCTVEIHECTSFHIYRQVFLKEFVSIHHCALSVAHSDFITMVPLYPLCNVSANVHE